MGAKKNEMERLVKIFSGCIEQHENYELLYSKKLDCYLLLELNSYRKDVEAVDCYYEPKLEKPESSLFEAREEVLDSVGLADKTRYRAVYDVILDRAAEIRERNSAGKRKSAVEKLNGMKEPEQSTILPV